MEQNEEDTVDLQSLRLALDYEDQYNEKSKL